MRVAPWVFAFLILTAGSAEAQSQPGFTRVLFPLMFHGPGAYGSFWTTEAAIHNAGASFVQPSRPLSICGPTTNPCTGILAPGEIIRLSGEHTEATPGGLVLEFLQSDLNQLHFALRARDVSRHPASFGTEIPVILESETSTGRIELVDIPSSSWYRKTLRIYGIDGIDGSQVSFRMLDARGGLFGEPVVLTLQTSVRCITTPCEFPEAAFAQTNVLDFDVLPPETRFERFTIVLEPVTPGLRYWAFVTATDNETQHVTIVTPQ